MLGTFRTLINAEKHLAGINKEWCRHVLQRWTGESRLRI